MKQNTIFQINKQEGIGLKYSKTFIEYTNDLDDIYRIIEKYNLHKEHKILILLDDMIKDMLSNKKLIQ